MPAFAQSKKFSVTFNPLSLLERDGGLTPGIGYNFNNRLSVYSDLGIIFFTAGEYAGNEIETSRSFGFKIKPAIRLYLKNKEIQSGGFFELEGMYKHVAYDAISGIDVVDNNGNVAYTYIGGYKIKKNVYGLNFKLGNRSFFDKEKRLGIDIYIGVGSRKKNFSVSGLPTGVQVDNDIFSENNFFNFFWRGGRAASFPAGAKLFYTF